jgi:hypothetical protein
VRVCSGEGEIVVAVTGDDDPTALIDKGKNFSVTRLFTENFADKPILVPQFTQQIRQIVRRIVVQKKTSLCVGRRHLSRDKQVYFAAMVLVIRETLINLSFCDVGKTVDGDGIHGFAVLQQSDDIVNADARACDDRVAAAHSRSPHNIFISF